MATLEAGMQPCTVNAVSDTTFLKIAGAKLPCAERGITERELLQMLITCLNGQHMKEMLGDFRQECR
jgi:hypothetical protein